MATPASKSARSVLRVYGPVWTIPDIKMGRLTEEALSAAGALWSPLRQNVESYFEAMVGFTQPFFITPCDGRKLR